MPKFFKKSNILIIFLSFLLLNPAIVFADLIPDDALFFNQGYLKSIRAQEAWDISSGEGAIIAVLDSGVYVNHPDLRDNIWVNMSEIPYDGIDNDNNGHIDDINGWDFIDNDNNPSPDLTKDCFEDGSCTEIGLNHGTIVAGVAAARGENGEGIIGLAYNAKIMPLKVLDDNGTGNVRSVIEGINYAVKKNADVINLSLVGQIKSDLLDGALKRAHDKGIIIVAASGNDETESHGFNLDESPMYPVCENGSGNIVLGVGALNAGGGKSDFSNYGSQCIDVSTIGENFYSTLFYSPANELFSSYYGGWWSGTSVATALVSGTAALIRSVQPSLSNTEVENLIRNNSSEFNNLEKKYEGKMGFGALNAYLAINSLEVKEKNTGSAAVLPASKKYLLLAPKSNAEPTVDIFNLSADNVFIREMSAYNENFRGGVNVAVGDINGDGVSEIITGAGAGGGPHVRVFDQLGRVDAQFFAYNENFRGGVNVAAGDLTGDNVSEIVTGLGPGTNPYIKVFDIEGNLTFEFFAYNENFRGGVNVAVGDINGDGENEIITGAGAGGGPHVRVFDRFGRIQSQFFAYNENFRGGVNVAVGDINGDGVSEIITGAGAGGGPHVRVFDAHGNVKNQFFPYNKDLRGGVAVASGDINNDGIEEIIAGPGLGDENRVLILQASGELLGDIEITGKTFQEGVNLAIMEVE